MAIRARRRKRPADDWSIGNLSLMDVVAFRSGHPCGEKIHDDETMKAARKFHDCDHTDSLTLADRERLFPARKWQ